MLCTAVMNTCVTIGGAKLTAHDFFQGITLSWFVVFASGFASVGSSHLHPAGPVLGISTFSLNNHFVGDCIQACGYNHLFYFGISK